MASKKLTNIINGDKEYLFQNYGDRLPVSFVKGKGVFLYDQDNKEYLDFFSGIAVSNLGYNHKSLTKAIAKQVESLIHSSNWFYNSEQVAAAELISQLTFKGKTLFVNSGTEANEAAIKLARKYGLTISKDKINIISFTNGFHGRTMGSMSATAQDKIRKGFGPLPKGFTHIPYNNSDQLIKELQKGDKYTAVIMELILGEGGIHPAEKKFVKKVRELCTKHKVLLILDEVQTGVGRTGKNFVYQHYDIKPDVITMAKGLGGGVPIGALHTTDKLSLLLPQGTHGTTFGGNHLACAAATAVLTEISKPALLENVNNVGAYIKERLEKIKNATSYIKEIRGMGLHIGFELNRPGMDLVKRCLEQKLILNCTAGNVIRIMPPLTLKKTEAKKGMDILEKILLNEEF